MTRLVRRVLLALAVPLALFGSSAGCEVEQEYVTIEAVGDPADWAAHVQPYVAPRCGTLDCHGDPGRPFRVYSDMGLRAGEDREVPLTAEELADNAVSALGVGPDADALRHPLIQEPLSVSAGGWDHVGGEVWSSREDPGYLCLSTWLMGNDPAESCATAAAAVPRGAP